MVSASWQPNHSDKQKLVFTDTFPKILWYHLKPAFINDFSSGIFFFQNIDRTEELKS